jgi:hypothetical protein
MRSPAGARYNPARVFEGGDVSLDLAKVLNQVDQLGAETAQRQLERAAALPKAQAALHQASALDPSEIRQRIERAGDRWRGASPGSEAWQISLPPPALPARWRAIGADGSQVYPDRHAAAQFCLVNVGSLCLSHGSGEAPLASSQPRLLFRQDELTTSQGEAIDTSLVNGTRDVAEMAELADLAERSSGEPSLTLLDNGLLLWLALQEFEHHSPDVDLLLKRYLGEMDRLRRAQAALAGFIDRPRGTNLLRLVELCMLPLQQVNPETSRQRLYSNLVDRDLLASLLPPGQRSAVFRVVSPLNAAFEARGHGIHFFYLNTGYDGQIARVEIPAWVAEDPDSLGRVHAGILKECLVTGIPYVLVRAHELAVVTQHDRGALEALIAGALLRQGIAPRISQKSATKRWTAARRRHRL